MTPGRHTTRSTGASLSLRPCAAGWTLTYIDAPHRFGVVHCPARQHSFQIDKTARGSETKAKEAIKKIAWCTHPGGHVRLQQETSLSLLDTAERLTSEVEEGIIAAEAKQDAEDALDRMEIQLETAASVWRRCWQTRSGVGRGDRGC